MSMLGAGFNHPAAPGSAAAVSSPQAAALQSEGAAVEADALLAAGAGEDGAHTWALECLAEGPPGEADGAAAEDGDGNARSVAGLHLGGAPAEAAGEAGRGMASGRQACNGTESVLAAAHGLPGTMLNGAGTHAGTGSPGGPDAALARGGGAAEPAGAPAKRGRGRPRRVKVSVTA